MSFYHQMLGHPHVFTDTRVIGLYGIIAMLFATTLYVFSAYRLGESESFYQLALRVSLLGLVLYSVLPLSFRLMDLSFSAKAVVVTGVVVPFYMTGLRWIAFRWIWIPSTQLRVWWIGDQPDLKGKIQTRPLFNGHHRLVRVTREKETDPGQMEQVAQRERINAVCIDFKWQNRERWIQKLVSMRLHGYEIRTRFEWIEELQKRIDLDSVNEEWFLYAQYRFQNSLVELRLKRFVDLVTSGLGLLIVVIPISVLLIILNPFFNRGPLIYIQHRVGLHEELFKIYKFRSMIPSAEKLGPRWASREDERVRWLGRSLRKLHLDELPQLWNILKGEMSMVGPRPERPEFVEMMEKEIPFYRMRHYVRPGLTGWAQINSLYADSIESSQKKLEFDLYYMSRLSLPFDLLIIVNTFRNVLFAKGR